MINRIIILSLVVIGLASCLKPKDELPVYTEANFESFAMELRWENATESDMIASDVVSKNVVIDTGAARVVLDIEIKKIGIIMPQSVYDEASLSSLVGISSLSPAARVRPLDGAPVLGTLADWSKGPYLYEVTAADGLTKKVWKLEVKSFTKI